MSAINSIVRRALPTATIYAACLALGTQAVSAQSAQPQPGAPRLDKLPVPANPDTADIAAIAAGFEAAGKSPEAENMAGMANARQGQLLIFVSFSMPPASLVHLAAQARKVGGVLLLNGLKDGSLTATAQAVYRIFGKQGAPLQVDPRAFERYAVNAVPSFVLLRGAATDTPCAAASCPESGYAKAAGDVSADYALEQIASARPALRPQAQSILKRMGR